MNGWKDSFVSIVGTGVSNLPLLILTLKVFLITTDAPVKSTLDIFDLESRVTKVLSVETSNLVARTFKSVTFLNAAAVVIPVVFCPNVFTPTIGNPPLHTPVTVATPTTEIEFEVTLTTLAKIGSYDISRSLY